MIYREQFDNEHKDAYQQFLAGIQHPEMLEAWGHTLITETDDLWNPVASAAAAWPDWFARKMVSCLNRAIWQREAQEREQQP